MGRFLNRTAGGLDANATATVILSEAKDLIGYTLRRIHSMEVSKLTGPLESFSYFFTAIACNSKCPPRSSDPAPINSRAGKSFVVK